MKKIISSAVVAGLLLGSTASAAATPVIDRNEAFVAENEEFLGEGSALLIVLLVAAGLAGLIFLIEEGEDDDDLPTSP